MGGRIWESVVFLCLIILVLTLLLTMVPPFLPSYLMALLSLSWFMSMISSLPELAWLSSETSFFLYSPLLLLKILDPYISFLALRSTKLLMVSIALNPSMFVSFLLEPTCIIPILYLLQWCRTHPLLSLKVTHSMTRTYIVLLLVLSNMLPWLAPIYSLRSTRSRNSCTPLQLRIGLRSRESFVVYKALSLMVFISSRALLFLFMPIATRIGLGLLMTANPLSATAFTLTPTSSLGGRKSNLLFLGPAPSWSTDHLRLRVPSWYGFNTSWPNWESPYLLARPCGVTTLGLRTWPLTLCSMLARSTLKSIFISYVIVLLTSYSRFGFSLLETSWRTSLPNPLLPLVSLCWLPS